MSANIDSALCCNDLTISAGGKLLVEALDLSLQAGDWLAVLGRNGVGKTLTLETLCGLRTPSPGTVQIGGHSAHDASPANTARRITLVTQQQDDAFSVSVEENVLLGRYPHLGLWRREGAEDRRIARDSLAAVDLVDFAERDVTTLSGGERQRAAIAQALTQDTPVLLLDEPLSHLDPAHAVAVMRLLAMRANSGYTLVTSLHDVNMAARFASHALLLYGDGRWQFGPVADILNAKSLSALYEAPIRALRNDDDNWFVADTRPAG